MKPLTLKDVPPHARNAVHSMYRQGVRCYGGDLAEWAAKARAWAKCLPEYNGDHAHNGWIVSRARWFLIDSGALCTVTRDGGMHSSGWWKNPDYERCWHLSLSFRDLETGEPRAKDSAASEAIVNALYGTAKRMLWCEPPYSPNGKKLDVWHYRLFMAPDWTSPLLPRGEVYSREFIEAGWKSWSDVQADQAVPNQGGLIGGAG